MRETLGAGQKKNRKDLSERCRGSVDRPFREVYHKKFTWNEYPYTPALFRRSISATEKERFGV